MKKLCGITSIVAAVFLCFGVMEAQAVGLGLYGASGSGSSTWSLTDNNSSASNNPDVDMDVKQSSFGLVFDTNVAKDNLFNYRLNLGAEKHAFSKSGSKLDMEGYFWSNTFGFGIVRTSVVRIWLGPQLSISYLKNKTNSNTVDMNLGGVGVAPVVGININLGSVITLALDGGYRYMQYVGTEKGKGNLQKSIDYDVNIKDKTTFINASLIFRIGDSF